MKKNSKKCDLAHSADFVSKEKKNCDTSTNNHNSDTVTEFNTRVEPAPDLLETINHSDDLVEHEANHVNVLDQSHPLDIGRYIHTVPNIETKLAMITNPWIPGYKTY